MKLKIYSVICVLIILLGVSSKLQAISINSMIIKSIKIDKFDKSGFNSMTVVVEKQANAKYLLLETFNKDKYAITECFNSNGFECFIITKKKGE